MSMLLVPSVNSPAGQYPVRVVILREPVRVTMSSAYRARVQDVRHAAQTCVRAACLSRMALCPRKVLICLSSREWRNWQTRWLHVPVFERTWGFKSPLAHSGCFRKSRNGFQEIQANRPVEQKCSAGLLLLTSPSDFRSGFAVRRSVIRGLDANQPAGRQAEAFGARGDVRNWRRFPLLRRRQGGKCAVFIQRCSGGFFASAFSGETLAAVTFRGLHEEVEYLPQVR